jgi:hypothetical protein
MLRQCGRTGIRVIEFYDVVSWYKKLTRNGKRYVTVWPLVSGQKSLRISYGNSTLKVARRIELLFL